MINLLRYSIFLVCLAFLLSSCNQDPSTSGYNLIPNKDLLNFKQFDSYTQGIGQKTSFYTQKVLTGSADRVLLGRNSYSEADLLYFFNPYIPDSIKTYINSGQANVIRAWMTMPTIYYSGNKSLPFSFSAYQIRSPWNVIGFDRDSLLNTGYFTYDNTNVVNSISIVDTVISFNIQNSVITQWIKWISDSTSAPKNYGLLFKPTPSTNRYIGFRATNGGTADQDVPYLHFILAKPHNLTDTIDVQPYMDAHVMIGSFPAATSDIVLEGSYAVRGYLYFDLSSLPSNSIITKATLALSPDTLNSVNSTPLQDTILVTMLADSVKKSLTVDSSTTTTLVKSNGVFTGNITWMVQKWINKSIANEGVMLNLWDELATSVKLQFFGSSNKNKALRPRLNLVYMQRN